MIDSLYIGATGMQAQQFNVDVVANNMANVNTAAFKKNRVQFEDLLYRNIARTGGVIESTDAPHRLGLGAAVAASDKVFSQGNLKKTDMPFDLAIRGNGFFQVTQSDGSIGYTRNGALAVNNEGMLVTADGLPLYPAIQVPNDATNVFIDANGKVQATLTGETRATDVGQVELATFVNPAALEARGDNLYVANARAGDAITGRPGENGMGNVAQGFLEAANVNLVEEMINLVMAQRAYELNAKVVQASDELLGMVNGLRR